MVFLNDFSGKSDLYQQQIRRILPRVEIALKQYNKQGLKSRVDVTGTTPFAVEIKLKLGSRTDEEIDFDILPAFDYLAQHDGKCRSLFVFGFIITIILQYFFEIMICV